MVVFGVKFVNEPVKPTKQALRVAQSRAAAAKREHALARRFAAKKCAEAQRLKESERQREHEDGQEVPASFLARLAGPQDSFLEHLRRQFGLSITREEQTIRIIGHKDLVLACYGVVRAMLDEWRRREATADDVK